MSLTGGYRGEMSRRRLAPLVALVALVALVWPAASEASHLRVSVTVSALLKKRTHTDVWLVEITWTASCPGAAKPWYLDDLYMVDVETGERHYVGGVVDTSGQSSVSRKREWSVSSLRREQHLRVELVDFYCYDTSPLHGGRRVTVTGNVVTIPPAFGRGSGGGSAVGPGGDYGSRGDPTRPLGAGGCVNALLGTNKSETLTGGDDGDVILGFGGKDRIRGRRGHDCLLGGRGSDVIRGERGNDRLTGGRGRDVLVGGPGLNAYDAGPGNDYVNARNGRRERVRCGRGRDRARVDRRDRVRSCERVSRPR
jgi:hypothetical protein